MAFAIVTKNNKKVFNQQMINISPKDDSDFPIDLGFDFLLTVQYDENANKCTVINPFNNPNFLFKGESIGIQLEVDKICKIMIKNSDEFIGIKILEKEPEIKEEPQPQKVETVQEIASEGLTKTDITRLYGDEKKAMTKIKIEQQKSEIEKERISIIKQVAYQINDLKNKISLNSKTNAILHIAMFFASIICAFGVGNYLSGLPLKEAEQIIQMPTNLKIVLIYAIIIFGISLVLKQGFFTFFQNKEKDSVSSSAKFAELFMIFIPSLFLTAIYFINVLYYINSGATFFAILMSLFFVGTTATLAIGCGYIKSCDVINAKNLEQYEYREDFETVIKNYQRWIELFINSLSTSKINSIKDKIFSLQLKSIGETLLGIATAPVLAYGVSNTLAMCFPEAAGWIRISGLRFSPVFLTLAAIMIVFGFFMFVNAFLCIRKVQGSNVLKQDGFSNYITHGVEIFGLEGVKKLNSDKKRSLIIGLSIISIEFLMNISYFSQTMGGDLGGMMISAVAALVVTAILIAETYMLSQTKYDIWTLEELISKIDKD